jgi:uncharacterized protein YjcR
VASHSELALLDYQKGMKYKEIAGKFGVTLNTVKSWKTRYKWSREGVHTKDKSVHTKTRGAQPGNKNSAGYGAPKKNSNAVKHGLFAKYLPSETLDLVSEIDEITPIDILWMNIKIQFASIMRSQQIMFVEDKEDLTKELKKEKRFLSEKSETEETEYELQFAWDKQANFLNSMSRAMGELRSMLKQFIEMANSDDNRIREIERLQSVITKTKKETEFLDERIKLLKGNKKDTSMLEALIGVVNNDD